ncbi:hypothetical protein FACS189419_03260 [Planctomycetales bacterium]|nr:hypothetical protein FACS189419_03260 [Planctomycetales bacterium]
MSYTPFDPLPNETPEQAVKRLRRLIAGGNEHLETVLAEMLMQSAQILAAEEKFEVSLTRVDEALKILRKLIKGGEIELDDAVGRCLLFRAAVIRFHVGPEAGVKAFNDAIDHFTEVCDWNNPMPQNELAVALMNKADILIEPLGAFSAAAAAQEQAVKIWERLVNNGNTEFARPLITSLLSLGDSRVHSGDDHGSVKEFKKAAEASLDMMEDGNENGAFQTLYLQSLYKLTKIYDKIGDIPKSLEAVQEAVKIANKIVARGANDAETILAALYLHLGMLYEKQHNPQGALEEYDKCRDAYKRIFKIQMDWEPLQGFMLYNGYANVLMCRGNVLTELRKFKEADAAFRESVKQYQTAAALKPADHDDDTLIPYSIGVVFLNHANMLATMGKLDEAVKVQQKAMTALRVRIAAGHSEIIPNLVSAHRKMLSIRQIQGNTEDSFHWLDSMIDILEQAVDDGQFEYRIDLASSCHHRSVLYEEQGKFGEAEKNILHSVHLFRQVADDEADKPEIHFAKIQWSETLQHAALIMIRQQKVQEAIDTLRKAAKDIRYFYDDGNPHVAVDVLLGYSQFIDTIEGILRSSSFSDRTLKEAPHLPDEIRERLERLQTLDNDEEPLPQGVTEHSPEDFQSWLDEALDCCNAGCELSLKEQENHKGELTAKLFFAMKFAYFTKMHGALLHLAKRDSEACRYFETASQKYLELIDSINNLKAKDKYYAAERGEPVPEWDIPGKASDDPYMDRYVYYANEYRQTMQFWAYSNLALGEFDEAEKLYETENNFSWELLKKGVPNSDRMLINSLSARANSIAEKGEFETVNKLYTTALELLRMRVQNGNTNWEDFLVTKNLHRTYALYLLQQQKTELARRVMDEYIGLLENIKVFPSPGLWLLLCQTLDVQENWCSSPKQMQNLRKVQKRLLSLYPGYQTEPELKNYAETLDKEIEG